MKLKDINVHVIERYYQQLLKTKRLSPTIGKKDEEFCSPNIVREVHKLLRGCFRQAVKWDLMEKNPCQYASLPKSQYKDITDRAGVYRSTFYLHYTDVYDLLEKEEDKVV